MRQFHKMFGSIYHTIKEKRKKKLYFLQTYISTKINLSIFKFSFRISLNSVWLSIAVKHSIIAMQHLVREIKNISKFQQKKKQQKR